MAEFSSVFIVVGLIVTFVLAAVGVTCIYNLAMIGLEFVREIWSERKAVDAAVEQAGRELGIRK